VKAFWTGLTYQRICEYATLNQGSRGAGVFFNEPGGNNHDDWVSVMEMHYGKFWYLIDSKSGLSYSGAGADHH
jgi:hypothetical protein